MKAQPLIVHLPDTRGVEISQYGSGNLKLGFGVFTYSRLPGSDSGPVNALGTCPGSTEECEAICYAKRVGGIVKSIMWTRNGADEVPPIPEACKILRLHVSGDFNSEVYINNWIVRLLERPDVTVWAYTRSWRVPALLPALERLRALPNVQLFASIDPSTPDLPPTGWRRAWIYRDWEGRTMPFPCEDRLALPECKTCGGNGEYEGEFGPQGCMPCNAGQPQRQEDMVNLKVKADGTPAFVCPEETGDKPNCLACGYCFEGKKHDVVFLEH